MLQQTSRLRRPAWWPGLALAALTLVGGLAAVTTSGCYFFVPVASEKPEKPAASAPETAAPAAPRATGAYQGPRRHILRSGRAKNDRGHLRFGYGEVSNPDYQELEEVFREDGFFENLITELDQSFLLPRDIDVTLEECDGQVNAFYDGAGGIHLCYELLEYFLVLFTNNAQSEEEAEAAGPKAVAALVFVFYHELGHALIDVLDLPATGREEDAVDQLATVILLESWEGEDSELALTSSAEWFGSTASEPGDGAEDGLNLEMADEHSLSQQRFFNLLCWTYGSDPDYFGELAEGWGLPEARAVRCPAEYQKMSKAWNTLLGPHLIGEG